MEHIKQWQIAGAIFTIIVGTLLHFVYEWSGRNELVAYIAPINESIWEHQKLLFTPVVLFSIIELFVYGKYIPNFIPVKVLSILIGILVIIASYYTYSGILGHNCLISDIGTFILGVLASYLFSNHFLNTDFFTAPGWRFASFVLFALLIFCFGTFTLNPPHIAMFEDSVTHTYGKVTT